MTLTLAEIKTTELVPEMEVYKSGYATGTTTGKVNSLKVDIQLEREGLVYSGWEVKGSAALGFTVPGDSDSLDWDREGSWCGLLFGGCEGEGYDYFIGDLQKARQSDLKRAWGDGNSKIRYNKERPSRFY